MSILFDNESVRLRLKYVLQVIDWDRTIATAVSDAGVVRSTMNSSKEIYGNEVCRWLPKETP